MIFEFFFFNDTATTEIYTLSLHDALPISQAAPRRLGGLRHGELDPLRLVVGPLVRGFGLEARGLSLQDQRLVRGASGLKRGYRRDRGKHGRGESDAPQEPATFAPELLLHGFAQLVGVDIRAFGHPHVPVANAEP